MAGFSGRMCDIGCSLEGGNIFQRSTVVLPRRHGVMRVVHRSRTLRCNAIALRSIAEIPWVRSWLRNLQADQVSSEYHTTESAPSRNLGAVIKDATLSAVHIGLSLTGAAISLASRVVSEWRQRARESRESKAAEKLRAAERQKVMEVQTQMQYEIQRKRLEMQGKDKAFVSMLHVLDRCHLDHDVKWALVQKHTADKAEFSERLQQLYNLAEASKDAVDTLLRPDASRKEINMFWKSPETVAIIAEEDKLKSLVFAQMLQASSQ